MLCHRCVFHLACCLCERGHGYLSEDEEQLWNSVNLFVHRSFLPTSDGRNHLKDRSVDKVRNGSLKGDKDTSLTRGGHGGRPLLLPSPSAVLSGPLAHQGRRIPHKHAGTRTHTLREQGSALMRGHTPASTL